MTIKCITVLTSVSTTLAVDKTERIADECGVKLTLVETRFQKNRKWLNDFDVEGASGKVDAFLTRIKELEVK